MNFARTLLLGLVALPLVAQSGTVSVGGALLTGLDSYKKAVNSTTGFGFDAGWETHLGKPTVPARLSLGLLFMPGKEINGLKTSLRSVQLSGDLLLPTGISNLRGIFGLSLNQYTASLSGTESQSALDVDHHFPFHDVDGIKGGLRFGVEYTFAKKFTAQALLQATELAGRQRNDTLLRKGGINPSWIQCGLRYTF